MAVKIIFFKFFGIAPSSAVFFTHENIGVDTKIAGLRHIHAELYQFEDIMGGQDGVVEKGSQFQNVYPSCSTNFHPKL